MSTVALKSKIYKSLDEMDDGQLQSAYRMFREIINQQRYAGIKVERDLAEKKIAQGIKELDNDEGTDFRLFLKEAGKSYGRKK